MSNNKEILVSIGIPIFNAEKYLNNAIRSVLNQTFKSFELILSDDGSTDNSLEIAKSFKDPRIIILSDGKNRGISYRLNEQIALAKGKYFARMDADDLMFPERIKVQFDFLQKNTQIDVIGSYALVIDDSNKILGLRKSMIPNTIIKCFDAVPFIHPTVIGKTDWFKEYYYKNELYGVEDSDLWIRSYKKSNFFVLEKPLLFYRDPLNVKYGTYKFRTLQLQKLYKKNSNLLGNSKYILLSYLKFLDYLKLSIYWILIFFKIDYLLIMRRNNYIDKTFRIQGIKIMDSILGTKII